MGLAIPHDSSSTGGRGRETHTSVGELEYSLEFPPVFNRVIWAEVFLDHLDSSLAQLVVCPACLEMDDAIGATAEESRPCPYLLLAKPPMAARGACFVTDVLDGAIIDECSVQACVSDDIGEAIDSAHISGRFWAECDAVTG